MALENMNSLLGLHKVVDILTKKTVKALIDKYDITLISVGNGTASRESELVIADMLKSVKFNFHMLLV